MWFRKKPLFYDNGNVSALKETYSPFNVNKEFIQKFEKEYSDYIFKIRKDKLKRLVSELKQ